jgi:hypothetical protein
VKGRRERKTRHRRPNNRRPDQQAATTDIIGNTTTKSIGNEAHPFAKEKTNSLIEKSKPIAATPPPAPETSTQDPEPKQREQKGLASASPKPSEQGC